MENEFLTTLPANVSRTLTGFVEAARHAFGTDLRSVVLYGSAAEGRLRTTSDVNTLLVLSAFDRGKADQLREPLRLAYAAIRLTAMFLLESEIGPASEAFAVKFADIVRRHRVLYGADPFAGITISRKAEIIRLKQALLNLTLRLRETYVSRSLREEQLVVVLAEAAGPLRSCAASLLELEGTPANSPKEALERAAASLPVEADWAGVLSRVSEARQEGKLPPGVAGPALFRLIELAQSLQTRANVLA